MYEVGDILITRKSPGHVIMVCEGGSTSKAKVIHAQWRKNFHIEPVQQSKSTGSGTNYTYLDDNVDKYSPPWGKREDKALKQQHLVKVARFIMQSAEYGLYRAFRLWAGNDTYGKSAKSRLEKYQKRLNGLETTGTLTKKRIKFVTTITCSEAVILCYQLTFAESDPLFIKLDAAHSMPHTLGNYLKDQGWG